MSKSPLGPMSSLRHLRALGMVLALATWGCGGPSAPGSDSGDSLPDTGAVTPDASDGTDAPNTPDTAGSGDDAVGPGPAGDFASDFLFGTAVAGFQVDMGCPTLPAEQCEDRASDWYQYITSPAILADPSTYVHGDPPSAAPGFRELWAEDVARLDEELHSGGFRFSLEWSRIFPSATDGVEGYEALLALADAQEVAWYHEVLAALRARGIEPLVTLNHYTLPLWIHDGVGCHADLAGCSPRGWVDAERTVAEIAKYAGFCAREFGAEVDLWATLNEPFAVVLPGYVLPSADRSNPPAVSLAATEAGVVFNALIEAHARMYDAVAANDLEDADGDGVAARTGIVYAMAPIKPMDPANALDVQAAQNVDYLWNLAFLDAVAGGELDADLDGTAEPVATLKDRMDYIGVNYYTRITVEGTDGPLLPDLSPLTTFNPFTLVPWENYPAGIGEVAATAWERYGKPIIITETGLPVDEAAPEASTAWMVETLRAVRDAIGAGVEIEGYFAWSLIDNYEWNHGMQLRFGMYRVEPNDPTKQRVLRPWGQAFADISRTRTLPAPDAAD